MNPHYTTVARRAGDRCEYCHAPAEVFNFPLEVEHVMPLARGGTNTITNLALACRACNLRKSVHVDGIDPVTGMMVPLFHPRTDQWHEHFAVEPGQGAIEGRTPIGRAAVARLAMNSPAQIAARRHRHMNAGVDRSFSIDFVPAAQATRLPVGTRTI